MLFKICWTVLEGQQRIWARFSRFRADLLQAKMNAVMTYTIVRFLEGFLDFVTCSNAFSDEIKTLCKLLRGPTSKG